MIGFAMRCTPRLSSAPAPSFFSAYAIGPARSPHAWLTIDSAAIDFDLIKSAPTRMSLRLRGTEVELKRFIERQGYESDDEGGPTTVDPELDRPVAPGTVHLSIGLATVTESDRNPARRMPGAAAQP